MGTINYFTSDYITMGIKPYSDYDLKQDKCFMEEMEEICEINNTSIEDEINNYIEQCYEDDYLNIKNELEKYSFYYYHVVIKNGYYEGFSIDIENNFPIAYDSFEDRKDAQKEITQIKKFLINCAGYGMQKCFPGWGTKFFDYNETIKGIKDAIKEMREEVKTISTWRQYEKEN